MEIPRCVRVLIVVVLTSPAPPASRTGSRPSARWLRSSRRQCSSAGCFPASLLVGVRYVPAVDGLVVAGQDEELLFGAADHPLELDLDRNEVLGVDVVVRNVAVLERHLELPGVAPLDGLGAGELDGVALLLVMGELAVEDGVFDDVLELVLAEGLGILLALPGLDLPAGLPVPGRQAGHPLIGELFADEVRPLVLLDVLRLEAAAAAVLPGALEGGDGVDLLDSADLFGVLRHDLVGTGVSGGSLAEERRGQERQGGEARFASEHPGPPPSLKKRGAPTGARRKTITAEDPDGSGRSHGPKDGRDGGLEAAEDGDGARRVRLAVKGGAVEPVGRVDEDFGSSSCRDPRATSPGPRTSRNAWPLRRGLGPRSRATGPPRPGPGHPAHSSHR